MSFGDYLLSEIIKEDHDLYKINKVIKLESMVYRIKDIKTTVGRKGYGLKIAIGWIMQLSFCKNDLTNLFLKHFLV